MRGKLKAKDAFLFKNLSLFVILKTFFFYLQRQKKNFNSKFSSIPGRRLFFFSRNFSLICTTTLFSKIYSTHRKITSSLKQEVFTFSPFFLKRKVQLPFELGFYLSYFQSSISVVIYCVE